MSANGIATPVLTEIIILFVSLGCASAGISTIVAMIERMITGMFFVRDCIFKIINIKILLYLKTKFKMIVRG